MTNPNQINVPKKVNWKILSLFVGLGIIGLILTFFFTELNANQQFYLRIFIGLSAAGIAAIIPGFFEINLKWLENTIKAGGAIAVFLLIYKINPPELNSFDSFEGLEGQWYYDVHPTSDVLGFGSKHYGGTVNFVEANEKFGKNVSMVGSVKWKYNEQDSLVFFKRSSGFRTIAGGVTADGKIIYEYKTLDFGEEINGFISFDIVRNSEKEIVELNGTFYRVNEPYVRGTVNLRRDKPFYE